MSCCSATLAIDCASGVKQAEIAARKSELQHAMRVQTDGTATLVLSAPNINCGACISTIEKGLNSLNHVEARVNLSLKRVTVTFANQDQNPLLVLDRLTSLGYDSRPLDLGDLSELESDRASKNLLKAVGIAGFAAANVMLLSVSIWSGAAGATRDLFHLISALIAIPAAMYAGQVFFQSALRALSARRLNMDVPISLAVILALGMSLFEALTGGAEAYFDAALTLLFFLLIGRYLDQRMREKAQNAAIGLARIAAKGATVIEGDTRHYLPLDELRPGMDLLIVAGERIPVDGIIKSGQSDLDRALVSGESTPVTVKVGMVVEAGILNLSGPLEMTATKTADDSFLAEVMQMIEAAEQGRGAYTRIADRAAQLYAPAVHALAALAFLGWMIATGDWHQSIYTAISVLIITCPCALGLAVPVVHVIGASRLFEAGILMKDGAALERIAEVTHVLFDKTGTLTTGESTIESHDLSEQEARIALALAAKSSHPVARAIAKQFEHLSSASLSEIQELPGYGLEAKFGQLRIRLGKADWVNEIASGGVSQGSAFAVEGKRVTGFQIGETLRPRAYETIAQLKEQGFQPELISGDTKGAVAKVAGRLGISAALHDQRPKDKIERIAALKTAGEKVLMVGDGLNDAPSLAAGDASMAPASASDVGRLAADFLFTRDALDAVPFTIDTARRARKLVRQNFGLAILYNVIAVPLAMAGFVTPLIAAIAMSLSSIIVVTNSLRLRRGGLRKAPIERTPTHTQAELSA